ncbi:hypothetical protein [Gymnodinialimonas sp.]
MTYKGPTQVPFDRVEIEIIATPAGEAPEWVRQAWVGVVLPLALPEVATWETVGVLSGPRTWLGQLFHGWFGRRETLMGYCVFADEAITILACHAPEAARWWRDNAPHLRAPQETLLFEERACRRVARGPWGPAANRP